MPQAGFYQAKRKQHRNRWVDLGSSLSEIIDGFLPSEFGSLYSQIKPYSMMSYSRLRGIYRAVCDVIERDIKGSFVECGTARGGCAGLMGLTSRKKEQRRDIWVYDTFEGLPAPSKGDPDYELAKLREGECRGEYKEVLGLINQLEIQENTHLVKGLFQETLPQAEVMKIAVLHVDGDWYESTKTCLDHLYDKVAPGGIIQIDDYGHWAGARKALHEFFESREIRPDLKYLDYTGRQFTKPHPQSGAN